MTILDYFDDHLNLCLVFMVGVQAVQYGWFRTLGVGWRRWIMFWAFSYSVPLVVA